MQEGGSLHGSSGRRDDDDEAAAAAAAVADEEEKKERRSSRRRRRGREESREKAVAWQMLGSQSTDSSLDEHKNIVSFSEPCLSPGAQEEGASDLRDATAIERVKNRK